MYKHKPVRQNLNLLRTFQPITGQQTSQNFKVVVLSTKTTIRLKTAMQGTYSGLSFRFCFNLEQSFWIVNNVAYQHGMTKKDVGFLL